MLGAANRWLRGGAFADQFMYGSALLGTQLYYNILYIYGFLDTDIDMEHPH